MADRREPSFGELLRASLRVCLVALVLMVIAFLLWKALRGLFPEIAWLQPGR